MLVPMHTRQAFYLRGTFQSVTSCLGRAFPTCIFSFKDTLRERMRKRAEGRGEEEGGAGEGGGKGEERPYQPTPPRRLELFVLSLVF